MDKSPESELADRLATRGPTPENLAAFLIGITEGERELIVSALRCARSESAPTMETGGVAQRHGEHTRQRDGVAGSIPAAALPPSHGDKGDPVRDAWAKVVSISQRYPWHRDMDAAINEMTVALSARSAVVAFCPACEKEWDSARPSAPHEGYAIVDIVFDGPPSHDAPRLVEVESPPGTGIRFGKWVEREDGYWVLRFTEALNAHSATASIAVPLNPAALDQRTVARDATSEQIEGWRRDSERLHWLHSEASNIKDGDLYEWGIYRVRWSVYGDISGCLQTNADFSDLDAAMKASHSPADRKANG